MSYTVAQWCQPNLGQVNIESISDGNFARRGWTILFITALYVYLILWNIIRLQIKKVISLFSQFWNPSRIYARFCDTNLNAKTLYVSISVVVFICHSILTRNRFLISTDVAGKTSHIIMKSQNIYMNYTVHAREVAVAACIGCYSPHKYSMGNCITKFDCSQEILRAGRAAADNGSGT